MPATDIEKLVVQLNADIRSYQRDLLKAQGVTASGARAIERRFNDMSRRLDQIGRNAANSIVTPLAGIAAALTVGEVLKYADAWTTAKNSLAVAGVTGKAQVAVLDQLFKSAQANATPIGALTDLFGKAAQASDNLGASQEDLLKFSDGVAVALKVAGTSAEEASGALQQLGQLLGSATVQAEEFNSVNDGARPILIAVAKGLDAAGGSVNKLKQLVNAGKLSGQQFFQAFLKGLPAIQSMAANSSQTISQGITKINNAFTRYIGQTDETLGASQRLVAGLNALADNFDETADATLKFVALIAGALLGRSIAGMIGKLAMAGKALRTFFVLLRAAQTGRAFVALGSAIGPIGALIGAAAAAATLFATSSSEASDATDGWNAELQKIRDTAKQTTTAVKDLNAQRAKVDTTKIQNKIDVGEEEIDRTKAALDTLFSDIQAAPEGLISSAVKKEIDGLQKGLYDGSKSAEEVKKRLDELGTSNKGINALIEAFDRFLSRMAESSTAIKNIKSELNAANTNPALNPSHPSGDTVFTETKKRDDLFAERNADAARSDLEKDMDTRSKAILAAAAKVGVTLTEAAARIQAKSELAAESTAKALDTNVSSYVDQVVGAESGGKKGAKNPLSSATGLGQFIERTWIDLFQKNFPDKAAGMTREAILALRTNGDISRKLIDAYARENAAVLQKAGVSVDAAALHLAHFLGPQGAIKVLKAAPGTPIAGLLDKQAIAANPSILGPGSTVDSVRGYAERRAGMDTPGAQLAGARIDFDQTLKEHEQTIAQLKEETGLRGTLNPLVDDYGRALSTLQAAQELLNEAQRQGIDAGKELTSAQQLLYGDLSKLSPAAQQQALAMRALAQSTGQAEAASNQLQDSQEKLRQRLEQSSDFGKDAVGGFVRDLKNGVSAADALNNALGKVLDRVIDIGVNTLFDGAKAGSGGGLLGGLFSFLFDEGGYTGNGPKHKAAGIVHKGEYVFSKQAVSRMGLGNLDAMHRQLKGYAEGGLVAPSFPTLTGASGSRSSRDLHISVGLAPPDKNGNLTPFVESVTERGIKAARPVLLRQASAQVVPTMSAYHAQKAGRDYRMK